MLANENEGLVFFKITFLMNPYLTVEFILLGEWIVAETLLVESIISPSLYHS